MNRSPWVINKFQVFLLCDPCNHGNQALVTMDPDWLDWHWRTWLFGYICILFEENPLNNYFYRIDEHYALSLEELLAYLKFDLDLRCFLKVIWRSSLKSDFGNLRNQPNLTHCGYLITLDVNMLLGMQIAFCPIRTPEISGRC